MGVVEGERGREEVGVQETRCGRSVNYAATASQPQYFNRPSDDRNSIKECCQ